MDATASFDRSEILAEALCEEIVGGAFGPGEKLNEKELAARFEVSRGPIREALKRLAERKLVVLSPNAGAKVAQHTTEDIIHLLDVREHLEGAAAKLAAERMTAEEKQKLHTLFDAHVEAVNAAEDGSYVQLPEDLDFHYVIIKASGNPLLFTILCGDFYPLLRMFRRQHKNVQGRGVRALEEHRRILSAIDDGDAELAEILMRRHIAASRNNMSKANS
ncbi:MAG: GntR family transcriptional regulator [Pseudomonadota bacterium]